jgi:hypothetical protein
LFGTLTTAGAFSGTGGRSVGGWRTLGDPHPEVLLDHRARRLRGHLADHDDRRQVGTEGAAVVRLHVGERERHHRLHRGLAQRRVAGREERRVERLARLVLRALDAPRDIVGHLLLDDREGGLGKGGAQLVVGEELHAAVEVLGQHTDGEVGAGPASAPISSSAFW